MTIQVHDRRKVVLSRPARVIVTAACLLIPLAGCTAVPASAPDSPAITPVPAVAEKSTPVVIDGVEVSWGVRGESIVVTVWGDSCPPVLSSTTARGTNEVAVRFEDSQGGGPCLEYLRQWSTDVQLPEQITGLPLTVAVTIPSYPDEQIIPGFVLD